ncbi:MAG: hypothetical protein SF066_01570 [Thermoanaerobaculia bacterium]|nr:hypothetical protein [Thermoanaerobaculia bacterium]
MRRTSRFGFLALALGLASSSALWADRLVLKDGTELETAGPWEVQGRLVVFHRSDGTLASIRASEVDLDKSAAATTLANTPAPEAPAPPPRKPSVLSLTELDLPPVGEAEAAAAAAAGPAAAPAPALVVMPGWRTVVAADGQSTELLGMVRNDANAPALGVQVVAVLLSQSGEVIAEIEGATSSRALQPGQTTSFRVGFENAQPYDRIEFRVNGELAAPPAPTTPPAPPAETETSETKSS